MSRLWVPPRVTNEDRDATLAREAEINSVSRVDETCDRFNKELRDIDPYLSMRYFPEGLPMPYGAVPGRYHLTYKPPVGPSTLISLSGPHGEFVQPTSGVFRILAEMDLQSSQSNRERERKARQAEEARARMKRREDEDRQEEIKDRMNAAFRTSVSMSSAAPWTQNASAASRRDAGQRRKAA